MKKLPLLTITTLSAFVLNAQQIRGIITDTAGKPLPFASVYIKETNKGTNANNEGRYFLKAAPGTYTIVCQYVGYRREDRKVSVAKEDIELNFRLELQGMMMGEVVLKNGEDPAYAIMRQAIGKRQYHQQQLDRFECEVYTKGQMRLRNFPDKFLGQKVDFEDGDTSKKKMIYLSETVSRYLADRPNKSKVEVISSKVSGQTDGFGLAAPRFLAFYDNNIFIGNSLNPRGFISPVSDKALAFYKYKYEGAFTEDGILVNRILVIPKRKFEPLFSGYINIVEDEWRIHSLQLQLVKASQMEVLDTLRIEQLYRPLRKDFWYVSSQVIYPTAKMFGFDMYGSFVNVYSGFNPEPNFTRKTFDNTIIKYTDSANKKNEEYWERTRPLPLMEEEKNDYQKKDSLALVRKDPKYLDSIDRKRNKISPAVLILTGQTFYNSKRRTTLTTPSSLELVNFNPAEGLVINAEPVWGKRLDTGVLSRRYLIVSPGLRYGFLNKHFNPRLTVQYSFGKKYSSSVMLSGGKKVFQFNNNSPIGERGNTISCLWDQENRAKTYEAAYFRGSYRHGLGHGLSFVAGFQYQDRSPLENLTNYSWRKRAGHAYTPNYPDEILSSNIQPHQAFTILAGISWRPGTKYVELPGRRFSVGSKYPLFSAEYMQGLKGIWGSDADFSKWKFTVSDNINLKLRGMFRYRLGMGGFFSSRKVQLPDYTHFNGNISTLATEYLNSFQLLPIYKYSNTDRFYALGHVEYNLKGFLTNKIPGIRNLNLYLVGAANSFYTSSGKTYFEYSVGLDNIFKQLRVDYVQSFEPGKIRQQGFRIGLTRFIGGKKDNWP